MVPFQIEDASEGHREHRIVAKRTHSKAEYAAVGFDECFFGDGAAAARTSCGFGKEIVRGGAVAPGHFIEDPIEWELGVFITGLA
jgi:hypothetical protein